MLVPRQEYQGSLLFLALSCVCGALLYGPHLGAPLIFDDVPFFGGNYASIFGMDFGGDHLRRWPFWTFAVQRILWGEEYIPLLRLGNLALHILTANALFLFLKRFFAVVLVDHAARKEMPPHSLDALAALGGLLFLLHPVAVYGTAYLVQRSVLMATLFTILMWLAHLRALESRQPVWFFLAVLCCYFALYSREHSIMAPSVCVLLTLAFRKRELPRLWLSIAFFAYFILAGTVALKAQTYIGASYEPRAQDILAQFHNEFGQLSENSLHLYSVLAQCGYFFRYIFLWLVPLTQWMAIDISEPLFDHIGSWAQWLGAIAFAAWCLTGFVLLLRDRRAALLGFSMMAPALLFMTEFSSIRIQEPLVLYRSYLWAPALFAALPLALGQARWQAIAVFGVALAIVLAVLAEDRINTFSSDLALWGDAIDLAERRKVHSMMRNRQYNSRGLAYLRAGNSRQALEDFDRALSINSRDPDSLLGRGMTLMRLGHVLEAKASFEYAMKIRPNSPQTYVAHAGACIQLGNPTCADRDLKIACGLNDIWACLSREKLRHPEKETYSIKLN